MARLNRVAWVILDLDDTLLDADGRLPAANAEAVRRVVARGRPVVLATGRRWASVRPFVRELGLTTAAVCLCGADIRQADGAVLRQRRLPRELAQELVHRLTEAGWAVALWLDDHTYWTARPPGEEETGAARRLRVDPRLRRELPEAPFQLAVRTPTAHGIQEVVDLLAPFASNLTLLPIQSHRGRDRVLILSAEASKEKAATWVGDQLLGGLSLRQAVAMGDGMVDLGLLRAAGVAVAMNVADPQIQAVAQIIAPPGPAAVATILDQLQLS